MQSQKELILQSTESAFYNKKKGGSLQVLQPTEKVTLKEQFSESELEEVQDSLHGKIVEFDLQDNDSNEVIKQVIQFISEQNSHWKGVEMSFTYQQEYLEVEDLLNLSKAISTFENLESLTLTFGSLIVSLFFAEDSPKAQREWEMAYYREPFSVNCMKQLLASIEMAVSKSPNLKVFKFDMQPQSSKETSEKMLQGLQQVNQQLNNCKGLEIYEISLNHCDVQAKYYDQSIMNAQNDPISLFFLSFEMLANKQQLIRFTLNICSFKIIEQQFKLFSKIFQYLQNKPRLTYFSVDHSVTLILSAQSVNHIISGLSKFLISNRNTLVTFYISFNAYKASEQDLDQVILLLPLISQCNKLERLSFRFYGWISRSIQQQKRFLSALIGLSQLKNLSFFHFQRFNLASIEQREKLEEGVKQLLKKLAEKSLQQKLLQISKIIQQNSNLTRIEQASSIVGEFLSVYNQEMFRIS